MDDFMQKFQALSMGEKLILVAGLVLLIASFLPWYRVDVGVFGHVSRNGWQSPGAFWSLVAVLIGLAMAGVVAAKTFLGTALPDNVGGQSWGRIHLAGGGVAVLFLIIKFINQNDFISFGFYIGFLAALGLAAGGALMFRDEGGQLPGMPPSSGPPAGPSSGPPGPSA